MHRKAMDTPSIGIVDVGTGVNSTGTGDVNSRFEKSLGLLTTRYNTKFNVGGIIIKI